MIKVDLTIIEKGIKPSDTVNLSNEQYITKCFSEYYGHDPTEYVRTVLIKNNKLEEIMVNPNDSEIQLCKLIDRESTIYSYTTITIEISENNINCPIRDHLNDFDIIRACWKSSTGNCIDVNKPFFHDISDLPFDPINELVTKQKIYLIGYMCAHQEGCDIQKCDLISCYSCYYKITHRISYSRHCTFDFIFFHEGIMNKLLLSLPAVCDKLSIIKTFTLDKDIVYLNMKLIDLDLYCITLRNNYKIDLVYDVMEVTTDDNFVVEYCCENGKRFPESFPTGIKIYAIIPKIITSRQLNQYLLLSTPADVSDIIYEYVDFESRMPEKIFEKNYDKLDYYPKKYGKTKYIGNR